MPNLAIALNDEIRRLARKEIKAQTGRTARAVSQYRGDIAQLKRQQRDLEAKVTRLEARLTDAKPASTAALNGDARFSARSVKAQRRRTGLSAADYAKLVGVSPLTIYHWEHNKSRPRQEQFAALIALRGLGKREAQAKLELVARANKKTVATRRRTRTKK
jgi:DNA-binding transcriptional regulator YiaG